MVPIGKIEVSFHVSGYCSAQAKVVNPKGGLGKKRFYATWALIKHPDLGCMLFDGGYNLLFDVVTKPWPDRLYRWITPVMIREDESAVSILKREGIQPVEVKYFIISHFHADHICALKDFPEAKFICSHKAFQQMNTLDGFSAIRRGLLKNLMPDDFVRRVLFIEDISRKEVDVESQLMFYLPFGQDAFRFVDLPGHARGMVGFYLKTSDQEILFATDAAWDRDAFYRNVLPSPIVKLFIDSWAEYKETLRKLLVFLQDKPKTEILFTHCPQTLKYVKKTR